MIARKERRDVALEVAGQLDRRHEPTAPVMLPSHGEGTKSVFAVCEECGAEIKVENLKNHHVGRLSHER